MGCTDGGDGLGGWQTGADEDNSDSGSGYRDGLRGTDRPRIRVDPADPSRFEFSTSEPIGTRTASLYVDERRFRAASRVRRAIEPIESPARVEPSALETYREPDTSGRSRCEPSG